MSRDIVEKKTFDSFMSGYCCSEAVCQVIPHYFGDSSHNLARSASAFCGGIAGSHSDLCGAYTGGLIALGWLFGRTAPGQDTTQLRKLASEYEKAFISQFGSTNCEVLLEKLEELNDNLACKKLTASAAGILYDLIEAARE